MKPSELPPELRPACRRFMLRHAAAIARGMLDYAEDNRLDVDRTALERIESAALIELAAHGDTIARAADDARTLPPEITKPDLRATTTREHLEMLTTIAAEAGAAFDRNTRSMAASVWQSLASRVAEYVATIPAAAD